MQDLAYNESNAFLGLGSGTIYLLIYIVNVLIIILMVIYILIRNGKCGGKNLLKFMIKDLFFNNLISMTMEGYFEFVIYGLVNAYTADIKTNGDVLGIIIAAFCLYNAIIFLPILLLWAIFTKNQKDLAKKCF